MNASVPSTSAIDPVSESAQPGNYFTVDFDLDPEEFTHLPAVRRGNRKQRQKSLQAKYLSTISKGNGSSHPSFVFQISCMHILSVTTLGDRKPNGSNIFEISERI